MEAKCPHCGTAYDVSAGEIGIKAVCETCHTEFVIGGQSRSAQPKRIAVFSRVTGKTKVNPIARSAMSDRGDVAFISPTIAKILQWLGYMACLIYGIIEIGIGISCIANHKGMIGPFMIACTLVVLPIAMLFVRLMYEGIVTLFEIVRHLREIRDKMDIQ
jgi:predicted Zn finger-like uncharacterized protein